jgi:hypothetical protein
MTAAAYILVSPERIGWTRRGLDLWLDTNGKPCVVSPNNPVVHVPTNYPDLRP